MSSGSASPTSKSPTTSASVKSKAKSSVPPVSKPDLQKYRNKINEWQTEVNDLHQKLEGINTRMNELSKGTAEFQAARDELRAKQDKLNKQTEKLELERNRLAALIEKAARSGRDNKVKIQELRKSLGFQTREEIDAKIRQIERYMMSKRLNVNEENKLIAEIRSLEKSKPLVSKYASMEMDANNQSNSEVLQLRVDFDNIKEEIKTCQQSKREVNDSFTALMDNRREITAPLRELSDEKDDVKRQIFEKRALISEMRDEMFRKKREFETYQAEISRAFRESKEEERRRRDVERQREDLQNELDNIEEGGWSEEIQIAHQIVFYLKKLIATSQPVEDKEPEKASHVEVKIEDGLIAMPPKREREEVYFFAPTKRKAARKPKKHAVDPLDQPIVHDIVTLSDFSRLGIAAPSTPRECPELLKALEAKVEIIKKQVYMDAETIERRKMELQAKLEALVAPKDINTSPVGIKAT